VLTAVAKLPPLFREALVLREIGASGAAPR
jgi:hypothetical protein